MANTIEIIITSPVDPSPGSVTGGIIITTDNGDGTWTLTSEDNITRLGSLGTMSSLTAVEVVEASTLTSMSYTFNGATKLVNFIVSSPDVLINVKDFNNAFKDCKLLHSFPKLNNTGITSLSQTWRGCSSLVHLPGIDSNGTGNVAGMVMNCTSLTCIGGTIDFTQATNTNNAFTNCTELISPPPTGTPVRDGDNALAGTWTNPDVCGTPVTLGGMKIGTEDITNPYVGTEPVNKVMLGDMLVWERSGGAQTNPAPPIDLDGDEKPDTIIYTGDNIQITQDDDSYNIDLDGDGEADIIIPKR